MINWSWNNRLNVRSAPYGSTILIALSRGPAPIPIPDVSGKSYTDAQAVLQAAGFSVTESSAPSVNQPAGAGRPHRPAYRDAGAEGHRP